MHGGPFLISGVIPVASCTSLWLSNARHTYRFKLSIPGLLAGELRMALSSFVSCATVCFKPRTSDSTSAISCDWLLLETGATPMPPSLEGCWAQGRDGNSRLCDRSRTLRQGRATGLCVLNIILWSYNLEGKKDASCEARYFPMRLEAASQIEADHGPQVVA